MFDTQSQHQTFYNFTRKTTTKKTITYFFMLFGYGFSFFYRMTKPIPYGTICPSIANRNNSSLLYMCQNVYIMYETQSQNQKQNESTRTKNK